jgi:hypothetical protein
MKTTRIVLFFMILLIAIACDIEISPSDSPDSVGSAVVATQTALGVPGPQESPGPTQEPPGPTQEPPAPTAENTLPTDTPAETPAPSCQPVHPGPQALPLPTAVAAGLNEIVTFRDTAAQTLATRPATGMTSMDSERTHLAGNFAMGANALPIVFFTFQDGGKLRLNQNNLVSDLMPTPNLYAVKGAEGGPYLAFVTVDMMNQSINHLYAADYPALPGAQPVFTWTPPPSGMPGNAIHPLAIHRNPSAVDGIWFTYTMWGIGNILFPPYKGLSFLDLTTATPTEFLGPTNTLGGISPDQALIAYGSGPPIQNGVTVRNLITCQETYIPFNPASNLGGGWMVFSPDNQMLAWTEAGGPDNMNATYRMRVARTDGTSLFDAPVATMTSLLGGETPRWLQPVGWIANHLLVLETYVDAIQQHILIVWAPDPSQPLDPVLGANQSAPIADGEFLGFVYP